MHTCLFFAWLAAPFQGEKSRFISYSDLQRVSLRQKCFWQNGYLAIVKLRKDTAQDFSPSGCQVGTVWQRPGTVYEQQQTPC